GRARTVVYNTDRVAADELPADLTGFVDPRWRGRVGWAPTNASFQAMVTVMRVGWGEDKTHDWLVAMLDNDTQTYDKNSPIVAAVGAGEIDAGMVNHYYLHRFLAEEGPEFPARNAFLNSGGPGALVLVAGAGILSSSRRLEAAEAFLAYLLTDEIQSEFVASTDEYPLAAGVAPPADVPALDDLNPMAVDLQDLADLKGTVRLLRDVGAMP
ncbi:MAG: extracellular solute-binding protein, partial [Anaerolineae bacterium]